MRLQRELETRPYIVVFPSILEGDSFIYLKIANHGKSAGQNLKLSLNKDVFSLGKKDRPLSEFAIFRQEIDSFPPNHEITYLLANGMEIFSNPSQNEEMLVF